MFAHHTFRKSIATLGMAFALIFATATGWAAPMLFNDQATFNTAITNAGITLTSDGFEDILTNSVSSPLARPGYTVTLTNASQIFRAGGSNIIDGAVTLVAPGGQDPLLFSFATPINAFSIFLGGLDLNPTFGAGDVTLAFNGGTPQSSGLNIGSSNLTLFLGVLNTSMPFSTLSLDRTIADGYNFDVVQFGSIPGTPVTPEAVPEPSTMLLLGSGLAGLAWWRHRKPADK